MLHWRRSLPRIAVSINELYSRVLAGDRLAENQLFEKMTVSFCMFLRHRIREEQDVNEVVQDTLAIVAKKYRDIEFTTSFSAWAYKTLEYVLLRYYRSSGNREKVFVRAGDILPVAGNSDIDPTLKMRLLHCLRQLSKTRLRHARILNLHFQGYSVEEIASKLKVSSNNFYVMLSRARSLLSECLETERY